MHPVGSALHSSGLSGEGLKSLSHISFKLCPCLAVLLGDPVLIRSPSLLQGRRVQGPLNSWGCPFLGVLAMQALPAGL